MVEEWRCSARDALLLLVGEGWKGKGTAGCMIESTDSCMAFSMAATVVECVALATAWAVT